MKKLLALLMLLILAACSAPTPSEPAAAPEPVAAAPSEPTAEERQDVIIERQQALNDETKEAVIEAEEQRIAEAVAKPQALPPRPRTTIMDNLLATYNSIDSYQFKTEKGTYYVRGDKARFLPRNVINKRNFVQNDVKYPEVFIDEIVFDRADKNAIGYCFGFEDNVRRDCQNLELVDKGFFLPYNETMPMLPDDWLKNYAKIAVGDEQEEKYFLNSIETTRIAFKDGVVMFFFPAAGVPIKVVKGPLESFTFENLVINRVRPEDVIHRTRDQISPNEVFYKPIY
jgi:hypothetical protein